MKKWLDAEVVELNISNTEMEWKFVPSWDGGYLGDGKVSGWFGEGGCQDGNAGGNADDTDVDLNSPS